MSDSPCFQLKGGLVPLTVLELLHYDYAVFTKQLAAKVEQAPDFYENTPIIIALEKLRDEDADVNFREICQLCNEFGIVPAAVRGGDERLVAEARLAGLAQLPAQTTKLDRKQSSSSTAEQSEGAPPASKPDATTADAGDQVALAESDSPKLAEDEAGRGDLTGIPSKIVRQPVRSGQQIYAPGTDLILLASVSAGAEVLADGSIHVYAPLRGRALAGVKGDEGAMIFCQSLEAELISIAGRYKVDEDIRKNHWKQSAKITLCDDQLDVQTLK